MSVSQNIKNEILLNLGDLQPCCRVAFLSAVFRATGSLLINSQGFGVSLTTENNALILFLKESIEQLFGVCCETEEMLNSIKNRYVYTLVVRDKNVLEQTGVIVSEQGFIAMADGIDKYLVEQECCVRSFVKGLFIGCGSVTIPKSGGGSYHLEFGLSYAEVARDLQKLLLDLGLNLKISQRGEKTVVYTKNSATISDVLAYLNANNAVMGLQVMLVEKNLRNNANRQKNCITANIDRMVLSAEKQLKDITILENTVGLKNLSSQLFEAAMARKENPYANMKEMAEICGVSKSGINHRMRKIAQLAQNHKQ